MVALFGGSFDPIHLGHLNLARRLADRYAFERVFFVPARQNPLKPTVPRASGPERLQMVRLALQQNADARFECLDWEVTSARPSFTLLTVERLRANGSPDIALILGDEVFRTLPRWHEPAKLLRLVNCVVATREGSDDMLAKTLHAVGIHDGKTSADGDRVEHSLIPGPAHWVERVRLDALPYSSTAIRAQIAKHDSSGHGLTSGVWDFIKENRLYTR